MCEELVQSEIYTANTSFIIKKPERNILYYPSSEELVTKGTCYNPEQCRVVYSLSDSYVNPPSKDLYSTEIPTAEGKNVGYYYV